MGNVLGRSVDRSKRVIWCDTEGGVRGVPLWDVAFIDEAAGEALQAIRMFNPSLAHKAGRAKLRKSMPLSVYCSALKTSSSVVSTHARKPDGSWGSAVYRVTASDIKSLVTSFLTERRGCVLSAWNMRAHDKHVLVREVGTDIVAGMVLWDALPWFRKQYGLPKNTLASDKPGTPRHVFGVKSMGAAHTSLADAFHLRDVVTRAAYCCSGAKENVVSTHSWKSACSEDLFLAAQAAIAEEIDEEQWIPVQACAWTGEVPESIKHDT